MLMAPKPRYWQVPCLLSNPGSQGLPSEPTSSSLTLVPTTSLSSPGSLCLRTSLAPVSFLSPLPQDLFRRVRSILNKLTPQMFQQLMKQVTQLAIDTEERLKGVIDLIFEKAISEPNFSVAYANMCRCLMAVSVHAFLNLII